MRAEWLDMVGGDTEVLREIIAIFLDDVPVRLAALRAALATGDLDAAGRAAHTLKGAAGNFAVPSITGAAIAVEGHARAGDAAAAREAAALLEAQLDLLIRELRDL